MELKQAFWILRHGSGEGLREYLKAIKTIEDNCVPVVRCKKCKCYHAERGGFCDYHAASVNPDWFCWNGERKDGDDNAVD